MVLANVQSPSNDPVFTVDNDGSVSETATNGTQVLADGDIEANDGDSGGADAGITYSITAGNGNKDGDGNSAFAIDSSTGAVTVNDADDLDFETTPSYTLTIRANDGSGTVDTDLTITVNDVAPSITGGQNFGANESAANSSAVGTVATTGDDDGVTFSIQSGNTGSAFAIDASTGAISVNDTSQLDASVTSSYTLGIRATDGTTPSDVDVTINVTDDVAPAITSNAPAGAPAANAASVDFSVTFDESVSNVSADNFQLTTTGNASGTISGVAGSGTSYTVTVDTIAGDGTLRLDLKGATDIVDDATNVATAYTSGTTHSVDRLAPTVTDANLSISGASGTAGAYKVGDTLTATWDNTASGDNNADIASVSADFSAFGGGTTVAASNSGDTWTATYTITEDGGGSLDTTGRNVSVTATDDAGNATTTADTTNATLDNDSPVVTDANISLSGASGTGGAFVTGDTVTVTWDDTASGDNNADTLAEVTVDFSAFGGGAAVAASESSGTWTASYTVTPGTIEAANRNASVTVTDDAGNTTIIADTSNATLDNQAPTVSAVSATTANGTYGIGETITVQVQFSEAVTVTGTPQLTLETGASDRTVDYSGGSGTTTLSFAYTIQAGDTSADLDYVATTALALNGATINDGAGNPAALTLPSPGAANSLGANKALVIDTVPTITAAGYDADTGVLTVTGSNFVAASGAANDVDLSTLTITGGNAASHTLNTATDIELDSATQFSVTLSGADRTAVDALLDQLGTSSSFGTTYNLAAADDWLTGADPGADISDTTGNAITVAVAPKLTSATYDAATGTLVVTATNIQANGGGADIDASAFTLTGAGGAGYTLTDTTDVERTSATQFTLTLSATDRAGVGPLLNSDGTTSTGGTTYNLAAADDWNTAVSAGDSSDATGNGLTVSNVPIPTLTSATYDASNGTLVVTGSGLLARGGAANDIDASRLTLVGEGGATYTLTDTADVELTSATGFTLTLSATDRAGVGPLLNQDGTSATGGTTYNLAAAEDWAAGAAAAVTDADLTANPVTVANVPAPTITSATYDPASGLLVVTATGLPSAAGAANDIDLSQLTVTGAGGATHTLTTTTDVEIDSATRFSATLGGTDKSAVDALLDQAGTQAADTTVYNLAAAEDWASGAAAAVTIADLTANPITVAAVSSGGGGGGSTPETGDDLFSGDDGSVIDGGGVDTGLNPTTDFTDTTLDGAPVTTGTTTDSRTGESVAVVVSDPSAPGERTDVDPSSPEVDIPVGGVKVSKPESLGLIATSRVSTERSALETLTGGDDA
ncbi:beta strand repeat-containing protein, partial [Marichromatium gracile]